MGSSPPPEPVGAAWPHAQLTAPSSRPRAPAAPAPPTGALVNRVVDTWPGLASDSLCAVRWAGWGCPGVGWVGCCLPFSCGAGLAFLPGLEPQRRSLLSWSPVWGQAVFARFLKCCCE